jgi:hypothetical protein
MKSTAAPFGLGNEPPAAFFSAVQSIFICAALTLAAVLSVPEISLADEGGVSFWVPGFFGSLAAAPQQPGWSLANIYYQTNVSAGSSVALAKDYEIGRVPVGLMANLNASVHGTGDIGFVIPTYVFATPVLGGQASVSMAEAYGTSSASLNGTLSGTLGGLPFGPRNVSISDTAWGFSDFIPQFALRWNSGVNNYMTYITGDVPIGAYNSSNLANMGIGHGAIDAGAGYTYFNPQTGHELSGVLGFTSNFINPSTQYLNGVDMHFDWAASQFLTKQIQVGLVGYAYKDIGCDSGSGDQVGCFQSQVLGIGPQIGFLFPVFGMQGYLNFKAYAEFDGYDRPSGWNAWVTFVISPAAGTPPTTPPPPIVTK